MEKIISGFLETLGRNSVEAGVLVFVVLAVQWSFGNRIAPRWRCALWLLVMARLLLPVSPSSMVSVFNLFPQWRSARLAVASSPALSREFGTGTVPSGPVSPVADSAGLKALPRIAHEPASSPSSPTPANSKVEIMPMAASAVSTKISWPSILFAIWTAGFVFFTGYILVNSIRVRRRFAKLEPVVDAELLELLQDCRQRLGIRRGLSISESPDIATPALYGFLNPRLLLPRGFIGRFSAKELRFVLLHELAHVKRRDILFNWFAALLQILHWFNPLIWWGFARWRADRELACDALALETAGDGQNQEYGQTILRLLENFTHRAAVPGLVGILEDKNQLKRRIRMIAGFRPGRKFGLISIVLFVALGLVCLTDAQNKERSADLSAPTRKAPEIPAAPRPVVTNGPAMKITVLDDATGQPLDHAEVFAPNGATFFSARENAPRWITDGAGLAVIRLGESPTNSVWRMTWLTISARKSGYAPAGMSWSNGSEDVRPGLPKEVTLRLKHGTTVGGTAVDEAGVVQRGIKVKVYGTGYDWQGGGEKSQSYTEFWNDSVGSQLPVTDAAGRWHVNDFPTDLTKVAIEFIRPDGSVEKFRCPPVADNPNEPQGDPFDLAALLAGDARFVLQAGYDLHGVTVDSENRPLAGVLIRIGYGLYNLERSGEIQSDSTGRFELHHLNHRQVILTAEAAGCAITSQIVDLPSSLPEVRLQLGALSPLRIHVADGDGEAIAGAKVATEEHGTEGQLLDFSGTSDAYGNLVWSNAPVSDFSLGALAPTSALRQQIRVTPENRDITFHLRVGMDKGIVVNGKVRDAKTGAPIKLESVQFQTAERNGFKGKAEISDSSFQLLLPSSEFRPGIYPSFELQLIAKGYALLITPWRDFDEGDWEPTFEMQPAVTMSGTALLPDGKPAAKAQLWTRREEFDGTLFINFPNTYYGDRMVKAQADAEGKFLLPEVPDDQAVVFTHVDGFLVASVAEVKRNPEVHLQPWGSVAGVLKISGKPQGDVRVMLTTLQWFPRLGFNLSYTTVTKADGSFTFDHVPPGEYKLYRDAVRRTDRTITEDHQMPVNVAAGETTHIEYSQAGRAVIGHAVADKPEVAVDWLNDDHTLSLKQSTFAPAMVTPKDYSTRKAYMDAYNASFESPERMKQVREARTYVLEFRQDGSFRAEDVPPGTYELKIQVTKSDPKQKFRPFGEPENVLGSITREIVVPAGNDPFDLGTLTVPMKDDGKRVSPVN
jgi:beta-lactamase regulating signal transducer with metallopeptidase domain